MSEKIKTLKEYYLEAKAQALNGPQNVESIIAMHEALKAYTAALEAVIRNKEDTALNRKVG